MSISAQAGEVSDSGVPGGRLVGLHLDVDASTTYALVSLLPDDPPLTSMARTGLPPEETIAGWPAFLGSALLMLLRPSAASAADVSSLRPALGERRPGGRRAGYGRW
ncbi:hypothetical protein AB0C12_12110 [Actinoplanes sp. NPDC048967]|uniref:hypothetical protein n=1 Tax=Actinoplanes sp. NPDC048967 TaxID=3155269 RepID=UPI0033C4CF9A